MTIEELESKRDYWAGKLDEVERKFGPDDYGAILVREKLEYYECELSDAYDWERDNATPTPASPQSAADVQADDKPRSELGRMSDEEYRRSIDEEYMRNLDKEDAIERRNEREDHGPARQHPEGY